MYEYSLTGVVVVMAYLLVRAVELLITRKNNKGGKNGGCNGLTPKEHDAVMGSYRTLSKLDGDGVPLAYTKRSYEDTQKEILKACRRIVEVQKSTLKILERWESKRSITPPSRST